MTHVSYPNSFWNELPTSGGLEVEAAA